MQTDCNQNQLTFEAFIGRNVVGAFDGGAFTSNGGALLLRQADRAIGLTPLVAHCFCDRRDQSTIVHKLTALPFAKRRQVDPKI